MTADSWLPLLARIAALAVVAVFLQIGVISRRNEVMCCQAPISSLAVACD